MLTKINMILRHSRNRRFIRHSREGGNPVLFPAIAILLAILFGCVKTIRNESVIYKDLHIASDTVWKGNIFLEGIITVETGAVLTIKPGTSVNFLWRDTNNDGIGESGIYVFGTLLAEGEKERLITFSSSSKTGKIQWEGLFFAASEGSPNILSYCRFENAYRAIHSHFSKLKLENTTILNNSRGFQFQESEVEIKDSIFSDNYSALRFRDSMVEITNTIISRNYSAAHVLRSEIVFGENVIKNNYLEGIRIKESKGRIFNCSITGNRYGILSYEGEVTIDSNFIGKNELDGISSNNSKLTIDRNYILGNGLDGISLNNSGAVLSYNSIAENKKFNLDNKGPLKIEAANNFWGCSNENEIEKSIEDGKDDNISGKVNFVPFLSEPPDVVPAKAGNYGTGFPPSRE
ncbi:MAG: right-handed parallel beta-helix repeat-containing protein [bacterium]